ncbi:unnamed protein product [Durusdinium trenchii]|uniref:Uncharacterized protein n=1 Tax=Durusdinium trenchii TaxID=1381693 RepID=A0ABP0LUD4_9DINO
MVMHVELNRADGSLTVEAKSLGGEDQAVNKELSQLFNRRRGRLHFCASDPCLDEEMGDIHVKEFRWYSLEGYASYLTASALRPARKWAEDPTLPATGEVVEPGVAPPGSVPGEPARGGEVKRASALREARKKPKSRPADADRQGRSSKATEAREEKEVTASARAKQKARHDKGKGDGVKPSDPGAIAPEKVEKLREELKRSKAKMLGGTPPDPPPDGGDSGEDGESGSGSSNSESGGDSSSAQATSKTLNSGTLMARAVRSTSASRAIKDGTTASYHEQLALRAAGAADKGHHSGGGSRALKKRSRSCSENTETSDGEMAMEAPLRKKSQKTPGSVLNMLLEHIAAQLQQNAEVDTPATGHRDITSGVKVTTYLALSIKPHFQHRPKELRELRMLATSLDLLRQGHLARLGDVLAGRLVAIHQSLLDSSWTAARHLEVMPMLEGSALSDSILLAARKHGREVTKAQDPSALWVPQRGKGKFKKGAGWYSDQTEEETHWWQPKGKSKKSKGRGKKNEDKEKDRPDVQQLAHAELIKTQMHGATNSGLEIFTEAFVGTDTLGVLGCSIAWLLVHVEFSESQSFTDSVRQTVFECCSTPQVGLRRGSIYPISLGELKGLKVALQESQLLQVQEPRFWERWQHRAWQFCALAGLNGTRGRLQPLALGPVNKMQGRAVASTGQSVCRFLHLGGSHSGEIERIRHELKGVRLSYTGEEMSVKLPSITAWLGITTEPGESLGLCMASAFYLFRLPSAWHRDWLLEFPMAKEIHLWVKRTIENVSSMDREAAEEISHLFHTLPYELDCSDSASWWNWVPVFRSPVRFAGSSSSRLGQKGVLFAVIYGAVCANGSNGSQPHPVSLWPLDEKEPEVKAQALCQAIRQAAGTCQTC